MRKSASNRGVVFLTLAITFPATALWAEPALDHLGAPPPGHALVQLKSSATVAPVQIMGTADPPSAIMNGSPLKLEDWPDSPDRAQTAPAAWLDGRMIPVEGDVGRFFHTLDPASAGKPELTFAVRDKSGAVKRASIQLNRCFLDAPIVAQATVPIGATEDPAHRFEFRVTGEVPRGSRIVATDAAIRELEPGRSELTIVLPRGDSVLAAKLEASDGSVRLLNIPLSVSFPSAPTDAVILSLEVPEGQRAGDVWDLPADGTRLRGIASRGSRLILGGKTRVGLDAFGQFSTYFIPPPGDSEIELRLTGPDGKTDAFKKKIRCTECLAPPRLARPRYRKARENYLAFTPGALAFEEWTSAAASGSSGRALAPSVAPGIEFGNFARHDLALSAFITLIPMRATRSVGDLGAVSRSLELQAGATLDYYLWPRWLFGFGAEYTRLSAEIESQPRTEQSVGLRFRTSLRFALSERWDWLVNLQASVPALTRPLYESRLKWTSWRLEPLAVRAYF